MEITAFPDTLRLYAVMSRSDLCSLLLSLGTPDFFSSWALNHLVQLLSHSTSDMWSGTEKHYAGACA